MLGHTYAAPVKPSPTAGLSTRLRLGSRHGCTPRRAGLISTAQGQGPGDSQGNKRKKKEQKQEVYEVVQVDPPPKTLGLHQLPQNTQCGEMVEVEDQQFMVSQVRYRYKLEKGKYRRRERQLDVNATGRVILNRFLDNLYRRKSEE